MKKPTLKQQRHKLTLQTLSMVLEGKNREAILYAIKLAEEKEMKEVEDGV